MFYCQRGILEEGEREEWGETGLANGARREKKAFSSKSYFCCRRPQQAIKPEKLCSRVDRKRDTKTRLLTDSVYVAKLDPSLVPFALLVCAPPYWPIMNMGNQPRGGLEPQNVERIARAQ